VTGAIRAPHLQRCFYTLQWEGETNVVAWASFKGSGHAWQGDAMANLRLGRLLGLWKVPEGQANAGTSWQAIKFDTDIVDPVTTFVQNWTPQTIGDCNAKLAKVPGLVYDLFLKTAQKGVAPGHFDIADVWFNKDFTDASLVAFAIPKVVKAQDAESIANNAKTAAAFAYGQTSVCTVMQQ